jgi:hypothetical protein
MLVTPHKATRCHNPVGHRPCFHHSENQRSSEFPISLPLLNFTYIFVVFGIPVKCFLHLRTHKSAICVPDTFCLHNTQFYICYTQPVSFHLRSHNYITIFSFTHLQICTNLTICTLLMEKRKLITK